MEYTKNKKSIHFCLPVYNEEKILEANVLKLLKFLQKQDQSYDWQIVILVNGSSDSSASISNNLSRNHPQIKFIEVKTGGRGNVLHYYWDKSTGDINIYMDIDLAVSLDNIPHLINPLLNDEADLVIGSRLLPNSKIERSFLRELSSQTYNFLSKIILRHNFSDMQCGFKAVKTEKFKKIASHIKDKKWFFDTELIAFGKHFGWKITEIPVDWSENRYDERKSKVNIIRDSLKFLINLTKLKIRLIKTPKNI
jgi:glycosyltransferase involved in cell wall biosynthesis